MKNLKNNKGFSIVLAMGLVLSISITVIYLLEYVMPFAKDTKGIEFSTNAYYQGTSAVEDALFFVATNELGEQNSDDLEIAGSVGNTKNTDQGYDIEAKGDTIPPAGEGNSEYDPDWNTLSPGKPVQLEIGDNAWSSGNIIFRVPETGVDTGTRLQSIEGGIVAWQVSSVNSTLNSGSETDRMQGDILKVGSASEFNINNKSGETLDGIPDNFSSFYGNNCSTSKKCTLKLSIINDLILTNETPIPYLEYQITGVVDIPLRYTNVKATGYSGGFKKDIDIKIPQQTINEAFDFTIFQ